MALLQKVNLWLQQALVKLVAILLMFILFSIMLEILVRELRGLNLDWIIDVNRIVFVWIVYLGAAVGFGRMTHIKVEFVISCLSGTVRSVLDGFIHVLNLVFFLAIGYYGMEMALIGKSNVFTTVNLSYLWLYLPVCFFGILSALFTLQRIAEVWLGNEVASR